MGATGGAPQPHCVRDLSVEATLAKCRAVRQSAVFESVEERIRRACNSEDAFIAPRRPRHSHAAIAAARRAIRWVEFVAVELHGMLRECSFSDLPRAIPLGAGERWTRVETVLLHMARRWDEEPRRIVEPFRRDLSHRARL